VAGKVQEIAKAVGPTDPDPLELPPPQLTTPNERRAKAGTPQAYMARNGSKRLLRNRDTAKPSSRANRSHSGLGGGGILRMMRKRGGAVALLAAVTVTVAEPGMATFPLLPTEHVTLTKPLLTEHDTVAEEPGKFL
jgi:hypothetical protein